MMDHNLATLAALGCLALVAACGPSDSPASTSGTAPGQSPAPTNSDDSPSAAKTAIEAAKGAAAVVIDCSKLCGEKSLGCANDGQCQNQCTTFRATCTAQADAIIRCNYARPMSDFECNPMSKSTQVKAGICADEMSAYMACLRK